MLFFVGAFRLVAAHHYNGSPLSSVSCLQNISEGLFLILILDILMYLGYRSSCGQPYWLITPFTILTAHQDFGGAYTISLE